MQRDDDPRKETPEEVLRKARVLKESLESAKILAVQRNDDVAYARACDELGIVDTELPDMYYSGRQIILYVQMETAQTRGDAKRYATACDQLGVVPADQALYGVGKVMIERPTVDTNVEIPLQPVETERSTLAALVDDGPTDVWADIGNPRRR